MGIGEKLRTRRQELKLTRNQLAEKIHVTPSAIANYENGVSYPKPDILISLINALETDANYLYQDYLSFNHIQVHYGQKLTPEQIIALKKYKMLSEDGRRMVHMVIAEEYERVKTKELVEYPCVLPGIRKLNTGFLLEEEQHRVTFKKKYEIKEMDFCFQIQVDQYEPVFKKYDVLALKQRAAEHNEIGLFRLNHDICYIRTLYRIADRCKLCALNVIEPDIIITPSDHLQCLGTVLGKVCDTCELTISAASE